MIAAVNRDPVLTPDDATDHIIGPLSAKVTIIEYGDFECPSCGQAHAAMKIMLKHFGHRVRFVFRHYPQVEVHPHAELAAEAAEAAGVHGCFWPFYDLLFEHQALRPPPSQATEFHALRRRNPHRSRRAQFTHRAPTSGE